MFIVTVVFVVVVVLIVPVVPVVVVAVLVVTVTLSALLASTTGFGVAGDPRPLRKEEGDLGEEEEVFLGSPDILFLNHDCKEEENKTLKIFY